MFKPGMTVVDRMYRERGVIVSINASRALVRLESVGAVRLVPRERLAMAR